MRQCKLAIGQLREYFAGQRMDFDLPLDWPPLDLTTRKVLETLMTVRAGETVTYGELAERSGTGIPARAIGSIMAANPLPLVIPATGWWPATGWAATPAVIPGASWRRNAGCWRTKEPCRPP